MTVRHFALARGYLPSAEVHNMHSEQLLVCVCVVCVCVCVCAVCVRVCVC